MDSIYQTELLSLARHVRTLPALDKPTHRVAQNNPVCGDNVVISVKSEKGRLSAHHITVEGCALCAAGAGLWHKLTHNDDAQQLQKSKALIEDYLTSKSITSDTKTAPEFKIFAPVINLKNRHKCVLLSFEAAVKLAKEL